MTFDANQRAILADLADQLIPAGEGFPSASQAEVAGAGLDQVLSFRPDLAEGLAKLLTAAQGRAPEQSVAELQRTDPAAFGILAEVVPGAYFLHPEVRAKLGYQGQTSKPIDPRTDPAEDGLMQAVLERGPIYRPTPGQPPGSSPP